jgi:hypothetical protein
MFLNHNGRLDLAAKAYHHGYPIVEQVFYSFIQNKPLNITNYINLYFRPAE